MSGGSERSGVQDQADGKGDAAVVSGVATTVSDENDGEREADSAANDEIHAAGGMTDDGAQAGAATEGDGKPADDFKEIASDKREQPKEEPKPKGRAKPKDDTAGDPDGVSDGDFMTLITGYNNDLWNAATEKSAGSRRAAYWTGRPKIADEKRVAKLLAVETAHLQRIRGEVDNKGCMDLVKQAITS